VLNITHEVGSLQQILGDLSSKGVNIEYMYGLSIDGDDASVVLKATDLKRAEEILHDAGIKTLTEKDILKI
jgi:hypothetical protein